MLAKYEKRRYKSHESVWVGKYRNLHNIAHWHLENEVIACERGSARIMVDNSHFNISSGKCVFCPSGSVHFIDADEDCVLLVCLFDEKHTASLTTNYNLVSPVFSDRYSAIERLTSIHKELCEQFQFFEEKTAAMITELIADIFRDEPIKEASANTSSAMIKYKQLINTIDENFAFISFEDAASFMCLSKAYFSKYFKKQSGMTFSNYLNVVKVEKAVNIIKENPSIKITDVMLQCGFNTIRNFNRTFKEITGYSPKHMPPGYSLNIRSVPTIQEGVDPTLNSSVLL